MTPRISSRWGLEVFPQDVDWSGLEYAIVESPAEVKFLEVGGKPPDGEWPSGLAFGAAAELRWLRRASGYHLVFISDEGECLAGARRCVPLSPGEAGQILLWGESQGDGTFYEGRIPHVLNHYPEALAKTIPAGGRLAAAIRWYCMEGAEEDTWLFRCSGLQPAVGQPPADLVEPADAEEADEETP